MLALTQPFWTHWLFWLLLSTYAAGGLSLGIVLYLWIQWDLRRERRREEQEDPDSFLNWGHE